MTAGAPLRSVALPDIHRLLSEMHVWRRPTVDLQSVWLQLSSVNLGSKTLVPWNWTTSPDDGVAPRPIDHLINLLHQTSGDDWQAVRIVGMSDRIVATMLLGPVSEMTVYLANRSESDEEVSMSGLPPGKAFRQQIWNRDGDGLVSFDRNVIVGLDGRIELDCPAESLISLSAK